MALLAGLALTAIALALVLSGSPLVVVHRNVIPHLKPLAETDKAAETCQGQERLPAGISAIRLTIGAITGPRIHLIVSSGGRVVTSGVAGEGWTSDAVTIPVEPSRVAYTNALVCFSWPPFVEQVALFGVTTSPPLAAHIREGTLRTALGGRVTLEYMKASPTTWWSQMATVASNMGLDRAPPGSWVALLVAALMLLAIASGCWLVVRESG